MNYSRACGHRNRRRSRHEWRHCRWIAEILGRKPSKGVKVEVGEKEAAVDLYIIVNYGVRIPEVAWNVQESVKRP